MIHTEELTKSFGKVVALDTLTCDIGSQSIYGLLGSNGAGKSTFLRLLAGIYRADAGVLTYQGKPVYGDADLRQEIIIVQDQPAFLPAETLAGMADFYAHTYRNWSPSYFVEVGQIFPLDQTMRLEKMSKGMQRQASLLLALSAKPKLLLMDEAFDGLDPVMRENLKRLLAREVVQEGLTCIIASHNLRELEGFCDQVGVLHEGTLIYEHELESMNLGVFKLQCAFEEIPAREVLEKQGLRVLHYERRASVLNIVIRNEKAEIQEKLMPFKPLILDILPLTLEELFIYELEVQGYAVHNLT